MEAVAFGTSAWTTGPSPAEALVNAVHGKASDRAGGSSPVVTNVGMQRGGMNFYFFAGAAGFSVDGSGAGAVGLSRRSMVADLRRLSTISAWARCST